MHVLEGHAGVEAQESRVGERRHLEGGQEREIHALFPHDRVEHAEPEVVVDLAAAPGPAAHAQTVDRMKEAQLELVGQPEAKLEGNPHRVGDRAARQIDDDGHLELHHAGRQLQRPQGVRVGIAGGRAGSAGQGDGCNKKRRDDPSHGCDPTVPWARGLLRA